MRYIPEKKPKEKVVKPLIPRFAGLKKDLYNYEIAVSRIYDTAILDGKNYDKLELLATGLEERFNATSFQQGLFFSVGGQVPNLIISLIGGWLADKYSRKKMILVSLLIYPLLMGLWPSMNSYNSLLLLQMIIRTTRTITMPATSAYLMDLTDENRRGLAEQSNHP